VSLNNRQFKIEEKPFNFKLHMKKTRFTETQIVSILNQQESGRSVRDICREHAIAEGTFYQWKNKYGGMIVSDVKRLKGLEEENFRLKRMFADLSLDHSVLKDVISKKGWGPTSKGN
jgi:putative transposase